MSGNSSHRVEESIRTLSDISQTETTGRLVSGIDLVEAARKNLVLLRNASECVWLHDAPCLLEAVRRYNELWMPLISDMTVAGTPPPMVLPPFDVEWIWFCHTLNSAGYRDYCQRKFSKMIGKPQIFDQENEEYALIRCKQQWTRRYPTEPFENEVADSELEHEEEHHPVVSSANEALLNEVKKHRFLYISKFSWPYMSEIVYLIAARQRYKGFLYLVHRFGEGCSRLVPSLDILLMWITHQSYPTVYAEDLKEMENEMEKVVRIWETFNKREVEETRKLWDSLFNQPYEKAGGAVLIEATASIRPPIYWEVSDIDVNTKYKSMLPRFLLEACAYTRLNPSVKSMQENAECKILRLRMVRCHGELKIDDRLSSIASDSWRKYAQLYCEFGTRGLILELRLRGTGCFTGSKLIDSVTFLWNDLLRAPSLTLEKEIENQVMVNASITPPVQAPYLLKCVSDRVSDDSGAMISDVILRMNHYKPQEGRWLSRTVLDHAGRECFVVRMRIGGGFWRRGGEAPSAVKWEDRITEICEGSWSYVAGSIGKAPEKVVGTATPKESSQHSEARWSLSSGDELFIIWESTTSMHNLSFRLRNQALADSSVKLLRGRRMQYESRKVISTGGNDGKQIEDMPDEEDEEGFVTLVRFTEDNPAGKATALMNWKLLIVEFMPEEDAVLLLLICISILRSVSEMRKEDVGKLLVRRRQKEAKIGSRDWGSVIVHPSSISPSATSLPHVQPWYWNAKALIPLEQVDAAATRQPALNVSQVEGGEKLYKQGIITSNSRTNIIRSSFRRQLCKIG